MLLSIITPTYNSEKSINDCLHSVTSCMIGSYEHIIIDNISKDNTLKIINNFKHEVCGEIEPQSSGVVSGMINFADQWIEVAETEVISSSPISASLSARKLVPIGNSTSNAI